LRAGHLDPLQGEPDPVPGGAAFAALVAAASASPSGAAEALRLATRELAAAGTPDARRKAAEKAAVAAAVEVAVRANQFVKGLTDAAAALRDAYDALRVAPPERRLDAARNAGTALVRVADFGVGNSFPVSTIDSPAAATLIQEQARLVIDAVESLDLPDGVFQLPDGTGVRAWTEQTTRVLSRVVGEHFPLISGFAVLPGGELAANLRREQALTNGTFADVMSWLRRIARVRPAIRDFHDLLMLLEVRQGSASLPLKAIQAPSAGNGEEAWAAQSRPGAAQRTAVLHTPQRLEADAPLCGWFVDAWIERIPGVTAFTGPDASPQMELAGLTFHYNQPDARAPHAVLIAVAPDAGARWTEEMLLQILAETLDLAKIRSLDHRDLPRLTPLAPLGYVLHGSDDKWPAEMDPAFF
jgi:hypothetical protein